MSINVLLKLCVVLMFSISAGACHQTVDEFDVIEVRYSQEDMKKEQFISLTYRNDLNVPVCFLSGWWPNDAGAIENEGEDVYIQVGGKKYFMKPFSSGYCIGGCIRRLLPGDIIKTKIPYKHFDLPKSEYRKTKYLVVPAAAYVCKDRNEE